MKHKFKKPYKDKYTEDTYLVFMFRHFAMRYYERYGRLITFGEYQSFHSLPFKRLKQETLNRAIISFYVGEESVIAVAEFKPGGLKTLITALPQTHNLNYCRNK